MQKADGFNDDNLATQIPVCYSDAIADDSGIDDGIFFWFTNRDTEVKGFTRCNAVKISLSMSKSPQNFTNNSIFTTEKTWLKLWCGLSCFENQTSGFTKGLESCASVLYQ